MNAGLWQKILDYDLDYPWSEYGFSTRLASDNYWTKGFTDLAILEYKKFMYLAAVSGYMVSPSGIVDAVWHQHLIFTQSYNDFCQILGKQVHHVPSTHDKEEFQKFKLAKERTKRLYNEAFGDEPKSVWGYDSMFESLHLKKGTFKIRTFLLAGITGFFLLTIPFYFALRSFYRQIGNPEFIIGLIIVSLVTLSVLELLNRKRMSDIVSGFSLHSFIYYLQPTELIYLKTNKLVNIIHPVVNELIGRQKIEVHPDSTIEAIGSADSMSIESLQAIQYLKGFGRCYYSLLIGGLIHKPIFWNTVNSMEAFKKYFFKSQKFGKLFYLNFIVLSFLMLLAGTRVATGILGDRPHTEILIAVVVLVLCIIFYLKRLKDLLFTYTIPTFYQKKLLPTLDISGSFQWAYFLVGPSVMFGSFAPLAGYVDRHNKGNSNCGSGCGSNCGSSCGSSGGSSCGSCGGCGGGD